MTAEPGSIGTSLSIGSQEWRALHPERFPYAFNDYILSTRCGLSEPGRSASSVSIGAIQKPGFTNVVWFLGMDWVSTRAEAAAAAWKQYADNLMSEHMKKFWRDMTTINAAEPLEGGTLYVDKERTWHDCAHGVNRWEAKCWMCDLEEERDGKNFWRDAYRYCR